MLLTLVFLVALLLALSYQGYQLNRVRMGKVEAMSPFIPQAVRNDDPMGLIKTASLADLAKENLMGDPNKLVKPDLGMVKLPGPAVNLILMGIMISSVESKSSAFIQTGMQTKRYFIGQAVEGGAVVQSITSDGVLLKRGDREESLRYPVVAGAPQGPAPIQSMLPVPVANNLNAPVAPEPNPGDIRSRLWRLPPATPGGHPRDREPKPN